MDAKGKVLHVCTLEKFIPPFIDFVEEHFEDFATRHIFFTTSGAIERYPYRARENIIEAGHGKISKLLYLARLARAMQQSEKIILHGLFNQYVVIIIFAMPWLLIKCYWIIWGGDLYIYQFGERNWKWKFKEFFRRSVIKNMGYLVTGTPGDVQLARKWYGARGQHIRCFNYPSNVFEPNSYFEDVRHSGANILVGNSADPSNNHKEVLDRLKSYKDSDIKIYCPLSYGDQDYAREVMDYGKLIFREKFFPLTEFLEREKYLEFLQKIDIAIFNHKRQQAFGNILMLLGYGKKVFVRKESTLSSVFEDLGVVVFDLNSININKLKHEISEANKKIIIENFSGKSLVKSLKNWIS